MREWRVMVVEIRFWMLEGERVSTAMGVAVPPAWVISRATVLMVEAGELGSGGKGTQVWGLEVVLADTTTGKGFSGGRQMWEGRRKGADLYSCSLQGRWLSVGRCPERLLLPGPLPFQETLLMYLGERRL